MEKINYISEAIKNIHQMYDGNGGGFAKSEEAYSYWLIVWKNGEEKIVDNFSVVWDGGLPKMNARAIKEIRSWFSGGPHSYRMEEVYTKDSYSFTDNAKEMEAEYDAYMAK